MDAQALVRMLGGAADEYGVYGLRADTVQYKTGERAWPSRQLFQDPVWDGCGKLVYPKITDGPNAGLYDAGWLPGTCAVWFDPEKEGSVRMALELVQQYNGPYIHIIGGYDAETGLDEGEAIIRDAVVLAGFKKKVDTKIVWLFGERGSNLPHFFEVIYGKKGNIITGAKRRCRTCGTDVP